MADSLLQEVDDALRADRAAQLWQKHRTSVIIFVSALILGTAINSAWEHYRQERGGKLLLAFSESKTLLDAGKADQAARGFKAIAEGASGELKDLALIWQSRALVMQEKKEEAIAPLKIAVADGHGLWNDIACLRLAGLDAKEATGCLNAKLASPLASTRAEWAAAEQWSAGDHAGAIAVIEKLIISDNTGSDARDRLTKWLMTMKAQEGKQSQAKE